MSGERRDESRGHRGSNAADRSLPSIREMFRDELDLPAQPNPYSFRDVQRALPRPDGTRSPPPWPHARDSSGSEQRRSYSLAPIQQRAQYDQSYDAGSPSARRHVSSSQPSRSSSVAPDSPSGRHSADPRYSYGVLRTSGASGALVNATPPSERPQGILRQTSAPAREDQEDASKRHRCDYCGKRFGMPSHLQIHLRTHTAQRPFACEYPNCDRTFSVRSNMVRHFRTHGVGQQGSERSKYEEDEYDPPDTRDGATSFSRYSRDPSASSGHQYSTSSQYYSSTRRS